jgi:hypothetical protein
MSYFPPMQHWPIENYPSSISSIVACICCRGNTSTEPLPSRCKGIQTQTDRRDLLNTPLRWAQVSWCTCQVSWRLVQAFKIWWGIHTQTQREHGDLICLILVFQNKESRLKTQFLRHINHSAVKLQVHINCIFKKQNWEHCVVFLIVVLSQQWTSQKGGRDNIKYKLQWSVTNWDFAVIGTSFLRITTLTTTFANCRL